MARQFPQDPFFVVNNLEGDAHERERRVGRLLQSIGKEWGGIGRVVDEGAAEGAAEGYEQGARSLSRSVRQGGGFRCSRNDADPGGIPARADTGFQRVCRLQ